MELILEKTPVVRGPNLAKICNLMQFLKFMTKK